MNGLGDGTRAGVSRSKYNRPARESLDSTGVSNSDTSTTPAVFSVSCDEQNKQTFVRNLNTEAIM